MRNRDPIVSGIFYPDDPADLKDAIDGYIRETGRTRMDALAVVSPHAEISYVGHMQAKALCAARSRRIENVVILSPRHRPGDSLVYLPESDYFDTPLGAVRVNRDILGDMESCGTVFAMDDIPHLEEHAIELQLPFIQRLYPEASIVPLIIGSHSEPAVTAVSRALEIVFADRLSSTLFLVTSNLASALDPEEAREKSLRFLKDAEKMDCGQIMRYSALAQGSICGAHCLAALCATSFMRGKSLDVLCIQDSSKGSRGGGAPNEAAAGPGEKTVFYSAMAFY
jgi:AmmeMemoRadiSam system protein B